MNFNNKRFITQGVDLNVSPLLQPQEDPEYKPEPIFYGSGPLFMGVEP